MKSTMIVLLGHTMRLAAESGALTQSRWSDGHTSSSASSEAEDESYILNEAIRQLTEYIDGGRRSFELPLRPDGTDFRKKVWRELQRIPYGETITYAELARRVGKPEAYRAVANACGANPLPIFIPCHRVVASGGKSGGYTGGLDIKLSLLETETRHKTES